MKIEQYLDLAVLSPLAKSCEIRAACDLANWKKIKSVCVAPVWVPYAETLFHNVSCVIGFPHGNAHPITKITEAGCAIQNGAKELDVVLNYGRFLDGHVGEVLYELGDIVSMAHKQGVLVKAILESCYYTKEHLKDICEICIKRGVDFIKSSTGYGFKGAEPHIIEQMLNNVAGTGVQVKASGGIRTHKDAVMYIEMGCTRLGVGDYWRVCE